MQLNRFHFPHCFSRALVLSPSNAVTLNTVPHVMVTLTHLCSCNCAAKEATSGEFSRGQNSLHATVVRVSLDALCL